MQAPRAGREALDDRQREGEGLARAGARAGQHVAARDRVLQDERLDRERPVDAAHAQRLDDGSGHAERGEVDGGRWCSGGSDDGRMPRRWCVGTCVSSRNVWGTNDCSEKKTAFTTWDVARIRNDEPSLYLIDACRGRLKVISDSRRCRYPVPRPSASRSGEPSDRPVAVSSWRAVMSRSGTRSSSPSASTM